MRGLIVALGMVGCGAPAAPRPLVVYRNAADAFELRLSASGGMAAMVAFLDYGKYEIRLWQRGADEHMVGRGPGTIIGVPSEQDVLVIDDDNQVRWLRDKREAKLALPRESWRFLGGSVDHDAHAATLAFSSEGAPPGTILLVDLDTQTMKLRDKRAVPDKLPASCGATGHGATLYVWCSDLDHGPKDVQSWRVSRHDGLTTRWSAFIDVPLSSGGDFRGQVTGDGSAFVGIHGLRETSRMRFLGWRAFAVDARDGRVRGLPTRDSLGFIDDLTPVPGRPAVAYSRWVYSDFDGLVVLDTAALTLRVAIEPDGKLAPSAFAVLPDGQFLVPGH